MISPRAIIRDRHIALPHVPDVRPATLPRWWRRLTPLHRLWLVLWAPWWVGNELPPPPPPRSVDDAMIDPPAGSPGAWLLDSLDDLRFRFGLVWTVALLLRGAWLGGLAGIAWLLLGLTGAVPTPSLRELATLAIAGAALGVVLRLFHRPRYAQVAMLLERAFDLRSRLSTAVAGLCYDARDASGLHALQLADAANALDRARGELRPIHWVPIREIFIGLIVALAMVLLLVAQRPEGEIAAMSRTGVPPFVPVSERLAAQREQAVPPTLPDPATLQQVEDISRTSNQAREDLEKVGGALQTNTTTAPAGDAIANEDYAGANQRLDDAAPDVAGMSPADRATLADELDQAGDTISDQNPELADAAHRAADDARNGEDTGAFGDLGDQIERTGADVIPQQTAGGDLRESSGQQDAVTSGSASGGESAQPQQPQAGEPGSSQGEPASQGDPGAGMNASAGTGESQDGSATTQGEGAQGGQQQPGGSGNQGQQASDEQADGSGQGQDSQADAQGDTSGGGSTRGNPNEEGGSSQGSGAGGGERDANDPTQEGGAGGSGGDLNNEDQAPDAGQGEAGEPPTGNSGETGDEQAGNTGGSSSIQLPGTSDERVRSGSDIGASSVGSGGGVGAGSGDSSGTASGSSGPDPNVVPSQWRTVVESYFREGGTP